MRMDVLGLKHDEVMNKVCKHMLLKWRNWCIHVDLKLFPSHIQIYEVTYYRGDTCTVGSGLRWFILWRFTFTTLVQSDRALPTCSASLS
jgi:hypothetical protein